MISGVSSKRFESPQPVLGGPEVWQSIPDSTSGDTLLIRRAVAGARCGELECFHFLYLRFVAAVRSQVGELITDNARADLVTQAVFASLSHVIAGYRDEATPFESWLSRYARSMARHEMARNNRPADG